jgi:hypothetical protein
MMTRSTGILTGVAVICMVGVNPATNTPASALPPFINEWNDQYPDSLTDDNLNTGGGSYCQVCHAEPSGGASWNGYGWSMREVYLDNGGDLLAAIIGVEGQNADNDPNLCSSIIEINADTQPGWTDGPKNTFYFPDGSILENQLPPAGVLGDFDLPTACCPADLDGDGEVGITDFLDLLAAWGPCPDPPQRCPADLDFDNEVGINDFLDLLASWGPCP